MTYLLRTVNKNRWYRDKSFEWLEEGDVPAETLCDLPPKSNQLSVWEIDNEENNLERLLTALAANRDKLDKVDYLLFSPDIVSQIKIDTSRIDGILPDKDVNKWHVSLQNLSANQVADLVTCIWLSPTTQSHRLMSKQVANLIVSAIMSGHISIDALKPKLREAIEKRLQAAE